MYSKSDTKMPLVKELGFFGCSFIYSFIQHICTEHLLCARCCRYTVYSTEQNKYLVLMKTDNKYIMYMVICTTKKKKPRVDERADGDKMVEI